MSTTSLFLFLLSAATLAGCSPSWSESLDSGPAKGPAPVPGAAENAAESEGAGTKAGGAAETSASGNNVENKTAIATFGAGCFWGVEAAYRQVKGVTATSVGFMGGSVPEPSYKQVCTDRTGHAEVVQIEYDPDKVSYDELLGVFWANHDPTTLDRQGPDVGSQYRSVIFFHTPEQEAAARRSLERQTSTGRFKRPIVTKIEPAGEYWLAEEYHQQYLEKRGLSTCHIGD